MSEYRILTTRPNYNEEYVAYNTDMLFGNIACRSKIEICHHSPNRREITITSKLRTRIELDQFAVIHTLEAV